MHIFVKYKNSIAFNSFQVIEKGHGDLHVARAPSIWGPKDWTSYLPCEFCHVWYKDSVATIIIRPGWPKYSAAEEKIRPLYKDDLLSL
jgi:hypothetical protein